MGRFKLINTFIDDLKIIEVEPFSDNRGYFYESYNENDFKNMGINDHFVQDNQSRSTKGVLRGLHFQINHPQVKLVRCIEGCVFDVAVDLRPNSKTFGKYYGLFLSEENKKMFYIPKNFAHGFLVISDFATFSYKVDDFYHKNDEGGIIYNDKTINIDWNVDENFEIILSEKDKKNQTFDEYKKNLK